jgi:glycosyltransferase involved in cell wall biosynthesis
VLLLIFGLISEHRLSPELARAAQRFPAAWRLVFHGHGPESVIQQIRQIDQRGRVVLSLDQVPQDQLTRVVSSATIGLVLYASETINDQLVAFSSEKIALSLQCGLPVIAFRHPGFDFLETERCGVLISTLDELAAAGRKILESYGEYHRNAMASFSRHFAFEQNIQTLVEEMRKLC